MKIQHLIPILFLAAFCTVSGQTNRSIEAQTETNTDVQQVQQYIHDYGSPKGTNTVTVKLRIHLDTKSSLSTVTVLSHESPILSELAKEIVERQTIPTLGKETLMFDEKGKPWTDKDVIYIYTFRFGRPLQEIEGDALGQLMKGGESDDQLKALAKTLGPLPDASKANGQK